MMTIEAQSTEQSYSPFHMLASSLAYCTWSVMYSWASNSGLDADDLIIEVHWEFAENPHRVGEIALTFEWPSLPPKRLNAAKRVPELCTVHATFMHPPTIRIEPGGYHTDQHELALAPAGRGGDSGTCLFPPCSSPSPARPPPAGSGAPTRWSTTGRARCARISPACCGSGIAKSNSKSFLRRHRESRRGFRGFLRELMWKRCR